MELPYSPWNQLPAAEPKTERPAMDYFYEHTAKHLIKDVIRIMNNGIHIDLDKVADLEEKLDEVLESVQEKLGSNLLIQKFMEKQYKLKLKKYTVEQKSKMKGSIDFKKDFKYNDMTHRSYFMHCFGKAVGLSQPKELLPTGIPKWSANTIKKLVDQYPILKRLLAGEIDGATNKYAKQAMDLLAQHKANIYNQKYLDNISNPKQKVEADLFNPASSKQKQELFAYLGIESEATSKTTGDAAWSRDQIERVNKETDDDNVRELTQAMIDHSFGSIIKNNFINAFYSYTVDSRLYGSYRLFGAKSLIKVKLSILLI